MPTKAFYWQLYIATYTALLGLPVPALPVIGHPVHGF